MHRRARSCSGITRKPNTKAAAQRLARVMSESGGADECDDEDLDLLDYNESSIGLAGGGRASRPRLPKANRAPTVEQASPMPRRPVSSGAPRSSRSQSMDQSQLSSLLSSRSNKAPSGEQDQPLSAHSGSGSRTSASSASLEQPLSAPSTQSIKTAHIKPSSASVSLGSTRSGIPGKNQSESRKDKRFSVDKGSTKYRESGNQRPASFLNDELDNLQEENGILLQKLRFAEERIEELEFRARQLEKHVVGLGKGVSMEARLLSRKKSALQQRESTSSKQHRQPQPNV